MKHFYMRYLFLVPGVLLPLPALASSDFLVTPTVAVTEDVTDNVFETPSGRRAEMVTRAQPGVGVKWNSRSLTLDGLYNFDYRYYARHSRNNEISHLLQFLAKGSAFNDFLRVDVSDNYSRISLDVARDTTAESLNLNQTDQNTLTVSPYLTWRLGEKGKLVTGVRYNDIRYWNSLALDRREGAGYLQLDREVAEKVNLNLNYSFTRTLTDQVNYNRHDVNLGVRYEYARNSFLFGSAGNSWQSFSDGHTARNLMWDAGVSRDFGTVLATLESQQGYSEDPLLVSARRTSHSLKVDKTLERGSLGLSASYVEYAASGVSGVDRHSITVILSGKRSLISDVDASVTVTGDRLSQRSSLDYPYHLTATGTLTWAFARETTLGLVYTYAAYRFALNDGTGGTEINRAALQLKKSF